jgi:hypothetical protein
MPAGIPDFDEGMECAAEPRYAHASFSRGMLMLSVFPKSYTIAIPEGARRTIIKGKDGAEFPAVRFQLLRSRSSLPASDTR